MSSAEIDKIKKTLSELQQEAAVTDAPLPTLYKSKVNYLFDKGSTLLTIVKILKILNPAFIIKGIKPVELTGYTWKVSGRHTSEQLSTYSSFNI